VGFAFALRRPFFVEVYVLFVRLIVKRPDPIEVVSISNDNSDVPPLEHGPKAVPRRVLVYQVIRKGFVAVDDIVSVRTMVVHARFECLIPTIVRVCIVESHHQKVPRNAFLAVFHGRVCLWTILSDKIVRILIC